MSYEHLCRGCYHKDRGAYLKKRAVFLDRDGTIIAERHYLKQPSQVVLLDRAAEGLRLLQQLDLKLVIITNQSGIKRGYFTAHDVEKVHEYLLALLNTHGIRMDGIYFSADLPEEDSVTRKPATGLITRAVRELDLELEGSYCIGDKADDIKMGKSAGLKTVLVLTGYGEASANISEPDHVARDLHAAATWIEQQEHFSLFEKQ